MRRLRIPNLTVLSSLILRGIVIDLPIDELTDLKNNTLKFLLARRVGDTPNSRFGWNWFTPLVSKYKAITSDCFCVLAP